MTLCGSGKGIQLINNQLRYNRMSKSDKQQEKDKVEWKDCYFRQDGCDKPICGAENSDMRERTI